MATSEPSALDLAVRAETGLIEWTVVDGVGGLGEKGEPMGGKRGPHDADDQPVPKRAPPEDRLTISVQEQEQGQQGAEGTGPEAQHDLGEDLITEDE